MAQTQTAAAPQVHGQQAHAAARFRNWGRYLFVAPALIFMLLTMVYPIVDNVRMSVLRSDCHHVSHQHGAVCGSGQLCQGHQRP